MSFAPFSFVFDTETPAQDPNTVMQTSGTEVNFMEEPVPTTVPAPIHPQLDQAPPTAGTVSVINNPVQIFDSYPTATDGSILDTNTPAGKLFIAPFQTGTTPSTGGGPPISNHAGSSNNTTMMTMIAVAGVAIVVIAGVFIVAVQKRRQQVRRSMTTATPDPTCCFPQRTQGFKPPVYGLGRDVEMGDLDDDGVGIVRVSTTVRNLYNETLEQSFNGRR
ncbi:UNVERIFIED_CONTAM: hypothetical protein HDU68_012789 [Siphonaria sp. JEL0065]|nr:hypothetical protein HDU68_012789 [Siphonaria sp. JEL0065]